MKPMFRAHGLAVVVLGVMLVLAACADDSGDRQFANEPRTPSATSLPATATPVAATPVSPARPLASPEALVTSRDAPDTVYGLYGGTLWAFDRSGKVAVTGEPIAAFAGAPDGERVAVVTVDDRDGGDASLSIQVFRSDGRLAGDLGTVLAVPGGTATPASGVQTGVALSWSPDGERLLLAHAAGSMVDVPIDGNPVSIETEAPLSGIAQAMWSPAGDTIGVVIRGETGNGSLALVDTTQDPAPVTVIAPIGAEKSVESFAWTQSGDGVVFLEGALGSEGEFTDGRLVMWDRATNASRVVATGGQAGPTGSIAWFHLSPDRTSVVYGVVLLTGEGWSFNGLIVRSLDFGQIFRLPVAATEAATDAWWLDGGLAWAAVDITPGAPEGTAIVWTDASGAPEIIASIPPAPPTTPSASPVASPVLASPAASPESATPVATPMASPAD